MGLHPCLAGQAAVMRSSTTGSISHGFDPGGNPQERQSQLWSDVISNPSDWWDDRLEKRSPRHPDFRHKSTKESLWLDSQHKPSWVDSQLSLLDGHPHGVYGGLHDHPHCGNGGRQVPGHPHGGNGGLPGHSHADIGGLHGPPHEGIGCPHDQGMPHGSSNIEMAPAQKQHQLWDDLFSNPSEWWDNRMDKKSPGHPDFRKKSTKEPLWLDNHYKPSWVDQKLATLGHKVKGGLGMAMCGSSHAVMSPAQRQAQFWKDLIANPSEWWDNRMDKKTPQHPDFRHKSTGHPLWLDSQYKPTWVDFQLATFNTYHGGLQGSRLGDELQSLCEEGQLDRALAVLSCMDQQDIIPSEKMYLSLLKACKKSKALTQAKLVHAHLVRYQVNLSGLLGKQLVFTLAKCGDLEDALQVFHMLSYRSVFSWTAMISGYTDCGKEREALEMYQCMQEEGVNPDAYTFVSLLRACGNIHDLLLGKRVHADVLKYRCESDLFVGACLIEMFAKCGSLLDAQRVFEGLSQRDVVSWTAMLSACVEHDQAEGALMLYNQMKEEGMAPDERTFVVALQACSKLANKEEAVVEGQRTKMRALSFGHALHADAWMQGLDSGSFVGSTLLSMYGNCGHILEAENVFQRLSVRTVVSWTVMLSVYVEQCQGEKALNLYRQMQTEGLIPNEWTFVVALQACCVLAEEEEATVVVDGHSIKMMMLGFGEELHAEARKHGFDTDVFVGSSLVTMYGKCGNIVEAENVFDGMSMHNVVSWNAMLSAYLEQGQGEKVPWLYRHMQVEGVNVNERTIVIALQACCMLAEMEQTAQVEGWRSAKAAALELCQELHVDVWRKGFDSHLFVGSALVNVYTKCGSLVEAETVFDGLSQHDVTSWNGMLSAYIKQGDREKALQLYKRMQEESVTLDDITLVCALQACSEIGSLDICRQIHFAIVSSEYDSNSDLASTLIYAYGSCECVMDAQAVFDVLLLQTVVLWNVLIAAYTRQGYSTASHQRYGEMQSACNKPYVEKALQLYKEMEEEGMSPNEWTYVLALQACCILVEKEETVFEKVGQTIEMSLNIGQVLHDDAYKRGFDSNILIGSALVIMYGKCGSILEAEMVFYGLSHHSLVSCNAMMSVYAEQGKGEKVLQLYRQMEEEGVVVADVTLVCVLQACSGTGSVELCRQIHQNIVLAAFDPSLAVANTLIYAYGSCASMADAQAVFDDLPDPNVVSWTALIAAYAQQGDFASSLRWYERMRRDGFRPNGVTFLSVLSACNHAGFVEKAFEYFASMRTNYGLAPDIEHYGIMLDLLGRVGDFTGVKDLLSEMPMQPDLEMWLCLLGSCRKHGNVELGKQAFDCVMELQPKHAGACVIMSNIYADTELQDSAEEADKIGQSGVWKKYDERWAQHEQAVPLLWQEMAISSHESETYLWQTG